VRPAVPATRDRNTFAWAFRGASPRRDDDAAVGVHEHTADLRIDAGRRTIAPRAREGVAQRKRPAQLCLPCGVIRWSRIRMVPDGLRAGIDALADIVRARPEATTPRFLLIRLRPLEPHATAGLEFHRVNRCPDVLETRVNRHRRLEFHPDPWSTYLASELYSIQRSRASEARYSGESVHRRELARRDLVDHEASLITLGCDGAAAERGALLGPE
jgi:hypothetical protein